MQKFIFTKATISFKNGLPSAYMLQGQPSNTTKPILIEKIIHTPVSFPPAANPMGKNINNYKAPKYLTGLPLIPR